jgi:hypothetical protein
VYAVKSRATRKATMWCMCLADGSLNLNTISFYKDQSIQHQYSDMPDKFQHEHWKNWSKTLRSYRKLGIKCVKVMVVRVAR